MLLLIVYLFLAVGVSFICSMCEAAILSIPRSYAQVLIDQGKKVGHLLKKQKEDIDRPLSAILTLNTLANVIGAGGVGAQATAIWGVPVGAASLVLALIILLISEIIPKTIGAVHGRRLVVPIVYAVEGMIWLTWLLVWALNAVSRRLRGKQRSSGLSREGIAVIAELARTEGALIGTESEIIKNVLRLGYVKVKDVMTPRTVVFMVQKEMTAAEVASEENFRRFSRIPVYGESPDDMVGIVLKSEIYEAIQRGNPDRRVSTLLRRIHAVPETSPVLRVLEEFGRLRHHIFLAVDEFGGTAGIVTLEDCLESVIGVEIVDETDQVADMRRLAAEKRE